MKITEQMLSYYNNRIDLHRKYVNYFGNKIGEDYSNHDLDKNDSDNKIAFVLLSWSKYKDIELSNKERDICNKAILNHYMNSKHHPEYWAKDKEIFKNFDFTSANPLLVDATDMDETSIKEMVADWVAMSKEFHNSPLLFFENNKDIRWIFSDSQETLIYDLIHNMTLGENL